ncbi:MAG: putative signal transducing protein [Terriglobia bacterium]
MPYCPQCSGEYAEGTTECADCGVSLRSGSPPQDAEKPAEIENDAPLLRIRSFSGPTSIMQAELARNLLLTEAIPCVLQGHMMGEILPGVEPITMLVRESDAQAADEILKAYLENPEPAG